MNKKQSYLMPTYTRQNMSFVRGKGTLCAVYRSQILVQIKGVFHSCMTVEVVSCRVDETILLDQPGIKSQH